MSYPVGQSVSDSNVFAQEQAFYWQQLRTELQRYKDEFKATNSELSKGLEISRQPLVDFMQASRQDLPVGRGHLKRLWHHLTSPEGYEDRKLSHEGKLSRVKLREEGPNRLLRAAGFLPEGEDENSIYIKSDREQQIQRLIAGLSNIPIPDSGDFIDLVDSLEKDLIEKAFSMRNEAYSEHKQTIPYFEMSEDGIDKWIRNWIKNNICIEPEKEIFERLKRAVYKLIRFGRYKLEDAEIFELYLSIHENNRINRKNELNKLESSRKIRISQCQFSTLTFSFFEFHYGNDDKIREELREAVLEAEGILRYPARDSKYLNALTSDVVVEALVRCEIFGVNGNRGEEDIIYWRYSSSATHFQNMLTAIYQGMGCENDLELVNFSLRSLGKKSDSLIKSSITFTSKSSNYQGIWVDESSVFGTAQAMFVAVRNWLTDTLSSDEEYLGYYQVCKDLASINYSLNHGRKTLNDYVIRRTEYPGVIPVIESIKKEVIDKIESINFDFLDRIPALRRLYGLDLERKRCMAHLICARSSHLEGDLLSAENFLVEARNILENPKIREDITLKNFLSSEEMLHAFYAGDREFIGSKSWRSRLDNDLDELQKYIYLEQERCHLKKYCGRLDLDIYRSASETLARFGRLDFCFSNLEDIPHLEEASSRLLMAAYCSAKVGDRNRATYWIANASRACCRLGFGDKALTLANLADEIIKGSIDNRYSSRYRGAIAAEVDIARAEIYLLIDRDFDNALKYFLNSLKGAAYLGFSRLMADSLYGVYRASKEIHNNAFSMLLDEVFSDRENSNTQERWLFQKDLKGKRAKKIVVDVVQFINSLEGNDVWSAVSESFKEQAKSIWHYWAVTAAQSEEVKHPVEDLIDSGQFLCRLQ